MSLGSWDPDNASTSTDFSIDIDTLKQFLSLSDDELQDLSNALTNELIQQQAPLMQLDRSQWLEIATEFDNDQLIQLIKFFTLAESLPGWHSGDKSPVIGLAKYLRKHGHKLDKDLLIWIKANSKNHFLPYGPLM